MIEAAATWTPAGLSKAGLSGVERRTMKRSMKGYGLVSVSFHGPAGLSRAGLSGVERRRRLGDGSTRPPLYDLSGVKSVHQAYIDSVHWHIIYGVFQFRTSAVASAARPPLEACYTATRRRYGRVIFTRTSESLCLFSAILIAQENIDFDSVHTRTNTTDEQVAISRILIFARQLC